MIKLMIVKIKNIETHIFKILMDIKNVISS